MLRSEYRCEEAMSKYRLSVIDSTGQVIDVYEPECDSDEEAYVKAEALVNGHLIDIWQGDRWIALLDGKDPLRIALAHHDPTLH
jgi:hypothetical protein